MDGITDSTAVSLSKLQEIVKDRGRGQGRGRTRRRRKGSCTNGTPLRGRRSSCQEPRAGGCSWEEGEVALLTKWLPSLWEPAPNPGWCPLNPASL